MVHFKQPIFLTKGDRRRQVALATENSFLTFFNFGAVTKGISGTFICTQIPNASPEKVENKRFYTQTFLTMVIGGQIS